MFAEACPHRVHADVLPLFHFAFVGPQAVIEKTALPQLLDAARLARQIGSLVLKLRHEIYERSAARPDEHVKMCRHQAVDSNGTAVR
jgi:hypothetical protein